MTEIKVKKPKNYINNADLLKEIELSRTAGKMTNNLTLMLTELCNRYAKHKDYVRVFSYDEDMKAFGMMTIVKVWRSFDPAKSNNPFSYFTQILRHAFYQYLNQEKKQREIKDEVLVSMGMNPSFKYMEKNDDGDDADYQIIEETEVKTDRITDIRDTLVDPDSLYHHDTNEAEVTTSEETEENAKD
jgi:DNA-directed RNA polymerase specialized sigma subunit